MVSSETITGVVVAVAATVAGAALLRSGLLTEGARAQDRISVTIQDPNTPDPVNRDRQTDETLQGGVQADPVKKVIERAEQTGETVLVDTGADTFGPTRVENIGGMAGARGL